MRGSVGVVLTGLLIMGSLCVICPCGFAKEYWRRLIAHMRVKVKKNIKSMTMYCRRFIEDLMTSLF